MNSQNGWKFDWIQISAIVLTVVIASSMYGLVSHNQSQAAQNVVGKSVVQAELSSTQPQRLIQDFNQWVARFKLSTENINPVAISQLVFYPYGTLQSQMIQHPTLYPLKVTLNGKVIGLGEEWIYQDGYIAQTVKLDPPLKINLANPAELDIYTDLFGQYIQTFGLYLADVIGDNISVKGLIVQGQLYDIKERQ